MVRKPILIAAALTALFAAPAVALESAAPPPAETSQSVDGVLKGWQVREFRFHANAGQRLHISVQSKRPNWLVVLVKPPGDEGEVIFDSDTSGELQGEAVLPVNGDYLLRAVIRRPEARRGGKVDYNIGIKLTNPAGQRSENSGKPFQDTLTLNGITFAVTCTNQGSINKLTITPIGLKEDNRPIEREIDGSVYRAEVADLNIDRSPEIYIYVTPTGSGSYGSLIAYSSNRNRSLSEIHLPDLATDKASGQGYMGHDDFAVVENVLARRFPVYKPGDTNAKPTGGMRQIEYKLEPGEAGWVLRVKKVTNF